MCCSGNVDVLQWNRKWFFSRHVQFDSGFHMMATNVISCNRLEIILSLNNIPCGVIMERCWRRESAWSSLKNFLFLASFWTIPDRGGCSQTLISSRNFYLFHLRLGIWNCHLSLALTLPLHRAFGRGVQMHPSAPILQCLRSMSPFQILPACNAYPRKIPCKTFDPNWCSLDRSFAEIGCQSTVAPHGITGPSNGIPNRLSQGIFPSDKRSWIFRR